MKYLLAVVSFLFILSTNADECPVEVSVSNVYFQQDEDEQVVAIDVHLERLNSNVNNCKKVLLGVTTGMSGSYDRKLFGQTDTVDYNIYKTERLDRVLESVDDARDISLRNVNFKRDISKTVTIYAKITRPYTIKDLDPGVYLDNLYVQVKPDKSNDTGGGQKNMSVYLNIRSEIRISLVDKGQPFNYFQTNYTLNYGEMVEGQTKGLNLIVKSNSGYSISVSSENDGRMKHTTESSQNVNYNFIVNGSSMSLIGSNANPITIFSSTRKTPEEGEIIDIDVALKSLDKKQAGTYSDFIYINAISRD